MGLTEDYTKFPDPNSRKPNFDNLPVAYHECTPSVTLPNLPPIFFGSYYIIVKC